MNAPVQRAWRFNHPDFDQYADKSGLSYSANGGIGMIGGAAAVRQSVLLLLSTVPGERLRRPTYGCQLHSLTFSPNNGTTHGLCILYIRQALSRWEPRIRILKLDAQASSSMPGLIEITLDYEVVGTPHLEELAFSFNLSEPNK